VDTTGRPEVIQLAYELTAADGRTVLVGVPKRGQNISIHSLPLHFGKVLTGSHGGEAEPERDIPRYVRLHQAGKVRLEPLVTDRFALEDVNQALAKLRAGEVVGRAMLAVSTPLAASAGADHA
jgi:Zn-dependent alcohol dehydrogenase